VTRWLRVASVLAALAACGGVEDAADEDAFTLDEADEALFASPSCLEAPVCSGPSQSRPSCFGAALERTYAFDTVQTFDVASTGTYNYVDLGLRRPFSTAATHLRVEIRELTGGIASVDTAVVRAWGQVAATVVARSSGWTRVRLQAPVTLQPSEGTTRRYALVIGVVSGRATVGVACTSAVDGFASGEAWSRKRRLVAGDWVNGPWRSSARDVAFAIGSSANLPGACSEVVDATCDDLNAASGDGCSSSCRFEPGFTCSGHPSVCADINECLTLGCGTNEFCRNLPGSYTCDCRSGTVREGGVCVDRTIYAATRVPDTTAQACTNGAVGITCPVAGEAFYGQDGSILTVPASYTAAGGASDWVTDHVTGLVWQRTVKATGLLWTEAVAYCENLVQGGHSDWRLPSSTETVLLMDFGRPNTGGLDLGYFTWDGNTTGEFHTSTSPPSDSTRVFAWDRGFIARDKTRRMKARCVRSATLPGADSEIPARYTCDGAACTANMTTTIHDLKTELTWERGPGEWHPNSWQARLARCDALVMGGFDDWRAPSQRELYTTWDLRTGQVVAPMQRGQEFYFSGTPQIPGFTDSVRIMWSEASTSVTNATGGGRMRCVRGP